MRLCESSAFPLYLSRVAVETRRRHPISINANHSELEPPVASGHGAEGVGVFAEIALDVDPKVHVVTAELANMTSSFFNSSVIPGLFKAPSTQLPHLIPPQTIGDADGRAQR